MAHAVAQLRAMGFREAVLWVLDTNQRARRFYEVAGWHLDGGTKHQLWRGAEFDEVRYQFERPFVLDSSRAKETFGLLPTDLDVVLASVRP